MDFDAIARVRTTAGSALPEREDGTRILRTETQRVAVTSMLREFVSQSYRARKR